MRPLYSFDRDTIFKLLLGGLIGFVVSLITLLFESENSGDFFSYHWFVLHPPGHAILIMGSAIVAGVLGGYAKEQLVKYGEQIRKLEELRRTNNEFVSLVTHQMRTPISGLIYTITTFLDGSFGKLTKDARSILEKNYGSLKNLSLLISDLLEVTKLESGRLGFSLQLMNLQDFQDFASETIQKFELIAKTNRIALELSFTLNPRFFIRVDRMRIVAAIENLLENSLLYTLPGGKVTVQVFNDAFHLTIRVSDTGIGIPKEEQPSIFAKFFRAKNAKHIRSAGTGIGLYMCREIVKAHQGDIRFSSEEKKGTTFTIVLPIVASASSQALKEIQDFFVKV